MTAYYVASASATPAGSNSNNGLTRNTAKLTETAGLALMSSDGDILYADGGTAGFTAGFNLTARGISGSNYDSSSTALTLARYPGSGTTLRGAGVSVSSVSHWIIDGISADNTASPTQNSVAGAACHHIRIKNGVFTGGGSGNGILLFSLNPTKFEYVQIIDCEISYANLTRHNGSTDASGWPASHGIYFSASGYDPAAVAYNLNTLVKGCNIHHILTGAFQQGAVLPYAPNCYGIQIYDQLNTNVLNGITIDGCHFHDNLNGCIVGFGTNAGSHLVMNNKFIANTLRGVEIDQSGASSAHIYNNTIDGSAIGVDVGPIYYVNNAQIKNNCITNCSTSIFIEPTNGSTTCTAQYNDLFNSGAIQHPNGGSTLSLNITTNPLYIDRAGGNFELQSTSPCIDTGTTLASVTMDFKNITRPKGSAYDIGAFEYVPEPAPGPPGPVSPPVLVAIR